MQKRDMQGVQEMLRGAIAKTPSCASHILCLTPQGGGEVYVQRDQFAERSPYLDSRSSFSEAASTTGVTTFLPCPGTREAAMHVVGAMYNCPDSALCAVGTAETQLLCDILVLMDYFAMPVRALMDEIVAKRDVASAEDVHLFLQCMGHDFERIVGVDERDDDDTLHIVHEDSLRAKCTKTLAAKTTHVLKYYASRAEELDATESQMLVTILRSPFMCVDASDDYDFISFVFLSSCRRDFRRHAKSKEDDLVISIYNTFCRGAGEKNMTLLPILFKGVDVLLLTPDIRSVISARISSACFHSRALREQSERWALALMKSNFRRTEPPFRVIKNIELQVEANKISYYVCVATGFELSISWCDQDNAGVCYLLTQPSFLANDLFVKCILQSERGEDLVCVSGRFDAGRVKRTVTLNGTEFHRTAKRAIESGGNKLHVRVNLTYAFFKSIISVENIGRRSAQSKRKAHAIGA